MPKKNIKTRSTNVKPSTQIDQQTLQIELNNFFKDNPVYSSGASEFLKYLQNKNYDVQAINCVVEPNTKKLPVKITKISEDLNKYLQGVFVFVDTTKMRPGQICFTIEKIPPMNKKPYVTYRPEPRIITQIHNNGVNGGTMFFSYSHKCDKGLNFNNSDKFTVISEDEIIYSPLTVEQATYTCKLLNAQSRMFYQKEQRRIQKMTKIR